MRRLLVFTATAFLGIGAVLGSGPVSVSASSAKTSAASGATVPSPAQVTATAQQYLGFPYAYIGDDPSTGFSCIGFVHYIFAQHGVYVPEDLSKAYASAPLVDQKDLQPGDLVFFQNTVWDGISHVDLYMGNGKMIGADSFQTGVEWDTLSDPYWQAHYLGATRPLSDPSGTPPNPSATPAPSSGPSLAPPSGPSLDIKPGASLQPRHPATVYSGPGDSYISIDTVTPSTTLTAVQTHGQWVNVSYNGGGQYGWVHGPDVMASSSQSSGDSSGSSQDAANGGNTTPISATTTAAPRVAAGAVMVVTAGAGVYSGPTTSDQVLSQLAAGARVTVARTQGTWVQVTLPDGSVGWVGAQYLGAAGSSSGSAAQSGATQQVAGYHAARATPGQTLVVTADMLYVRTDADYHASIMRRVHAGDRLQLLSANRDWDYVALRDGSRGWVNAAWVRPQ